MNFDLKWLPAHNDYYMFGSVLEFKNDSVYFYHPLFPPGASIVKWISNPNYQANRCLVQLPLLKRGVIYHFIPDIEVSPAKSIIFGLSFYNRFGEMIKTCFFEEEGGRFSCSQDTFSYSLEIIGRGISQLKFNKIVLKSSKTEKFIVGRENNEI